MPRIDHSKNLVRLFKANNGLTSIGLRNKHK